MVEEVLLGLLAKTKRIFLDGTVGYGGHAEALLKAADAPAQLIGLDWDLEALAATGKRLAPFGDRVFLAQAGFADFDNIFKQHGIEMVDAILLDLGVSSPQLDEANRGFSFRIKGPLDMRMNPHSSPNAMEIIAQSSEQELADLFFHYGEERYARRYARAIVQERKKSAIGDTERLANIIHRAAPQRGFRRLDAATRVFQALRIAVNRELETLKNFLDKFPAWLKPQGRIAILAYHSLEDRLVKSAFRTYANGGQLRLITKKPLRPSPTEVTANRRARSARLRIAERV